MGICKSSNSSHSSPSQTKNISPPKRNTSPSNSIYKKEEDFSPEFSDMPLWEGNRRKGFGIKEMQGYKCSMKINELNELREKFWLSRTKNKSQWKIIHQACVYDHIKAELYLAKHNIRTVNGCLNECIDEQNFVYKVPNFCINDPYYELELLPVDNSHNEMINVVLMDLVHFNKNKIKLKESCTGEEIVKQYAEKHNIDLTKNRIRLLFGGGIIKDSESLYQHKIKNGFNIQICISPID